MSITTVDGIVAGLLPGSTYQKASFTGQAAGNVATLMRRAGNPGAATLGTPGLNGANVSQSTLGGALPYTNPNSPALGYLAQMSMALGSNMTAFTLFDLLWYNTGLTVTTTTAQSITTPTFNSRCVPASGTTPDANGGGLEAWLMCTSATTNAGAISNTTIAYTNQSGSGSRSAGTVYSSPANMVTETIIPFALQAGDTGIRSVQSVTLGTSYVTGSLSLLIVRRVAEIYLPTSPAGSTYDFASLGLPRIYDSSALYGAVLLSGTAAGATAGMFKFAQG